MDKLKVIFRKEKNPYVTGDSYLAAFPDLSASTGNILCLPFTIRPDGFATFFCHDEASLSYYYTTKIVHVNTLEAQACKQIVEKYYNSMPGDPVELVLSERIARSHT